MVVKTSILLKTGIPKGDGVHHVVRLISLGKFTIEARHIWNISGNNSLPNCDWTTGYPCEIDIGRHHKKISKGEYNAMITYISYNVNEQENYVFAKLNYIQRFKINWMYNRTIFHNSGFWTIVGGIITAILFVYFLLDRYHLVPIEKKPSHNKSQEELKVKPPKIEVPIEMKPMIFFPDSVTYKKPIKQVKIKVIDSDISH